MTTLDNVKRVLDYLELSHSVRLDAAQVTDNSVHVWPVSHDILLHALFGHWNTDPKCSEEFFHGEGSISFREPHVHPSLHVVLHKSDDVLEPWLYWLEMHCDFWNPELGIGLLGHGVEVAQNAITRRVTDQDKMWESLQHRFKEFG